MVKQDPTRGPCVCARGCPYPTRPARHWYAVENTPLNPVPGYSSPVLMVPSAGLPTLCTWQNESPVAGAPSDSKLRFLPVGIIDDPFSYRWEFTFFTGSPAQQTWRLDTFWLEADYPEPATTIANCNGTKILLTQQVGPGNLRIVSVPAYVCTQAQLDVFLSG